MPRRAGKRRTAKRALIAKIKEAQKKDEETRRAAPRIIEEQILLDLPPLLRVKPSEERKGKREEEERDSGDSLHLFPEELDRDLDWSPDEFDREYFRLWEEENNERWEQKRERRRRKLEVLFGEDSETEGERREIEKDKREREERERKAEEIKLFGIISDSEEETGMEIEEERSENMEWEEEGEEREMDWEEADEDVIIIEGKSRIEELEENIDREIAERERRERKGGAAASRAIVPKKVQSYWLKARSRLYLSLPLPLKRKI